jgi:hypothetical protein
MCSPIRFTLPAATANPQHNRAARRGQSQSQPRTSTQPHTREQSSDGDGRTWGAGEERGAGAVDGVEAVPEAGEAEARLVELRARAVDRLQRGERRHELRRLGGGGAG